MKRAFDLGVCLVLALPVAVVVWLCSVAIRLDSPGPVFFRQTRVGRGGAPFEILKLRSMVQDAAQKGGFATQAGDARITRVGRVLRKTSLDELPQLWNVLRGEMSLVGPRPDVPAQRDLYTDAEFALRHSVRPGITGLAQASGRSSLTVEARRALDLEYARTASLSLDLRILWRTLTRLFSNTT
ncbi:MAG: sugar transferase [Pseudomonadota bacterium]